MSSEGEAEGGGEGTGPCIGCGEMNHTAHRVSICGECVAATRQTRGRQPVMTASGVEWVSVAKECSEAYRLRAQLKEKTGAQPGPHYEQCAVESCDQLARMCAPHSHQECLREHCEKRAMYCNEHVDEATQKELEDAYLYMDEIRAAKPRCRTFACNDEASRCEKCCNERAVQRCSWEDCRQAADICRTHVEERLAAEREQRRIISDVGNTVRVSFSPFEAAMVLCVLAVAKAGDSRYDTAAEPLRRRAIEAAYVRLSCEMALPKELSEAEPDA